MQAPQQRGAEAPPEESARRVEARSAALDRLLSKAAFLGHREGDKVNVSFTSIMLAFFVSDDACSTWVRAIAPQLALGAENIAPTGSIALSRVREAKGAVTAEVGALTASAEAVLRAATDLAGAVGASAVDGFHVFATYVFAPPGHDEDLQRWHFRRERWATLFIEQAAIRSSTEADAWRSIRAKTLPPRALSGGVTEVVLWASALASARSPEKAVVDADALVGGILLHGNQHPKSLATSSQLLAALGSRLADFIHGDRPTQRGSERPAEFTAAANALIDGAAYYAQLRSDGVVHVRHLIAAVLFGPRADVGTVRATLTRAVAIGVLRDKFLAWMRAAGDDVAGWSRLTEVSPLEAQPFAGYHNDDPSRGEDLLDIKREALGLARILAASKVVPPLSVGLFGDWGSGKSFFMRELRGAIEQCRTWSVARAEAGGVAHYCQRVIHIEFNAWHYADADLWASLAMQIFNRIHEELAKDGDSARLLGENVVAKLPSSQEIIARGNAERDALEARKKKLEDEIKAERERRGTKTVGVLEALRDLGESGASADEISAWKNAIKAVGIPEAEVDKVLEGLASTSKLTKRIDKLFQARPWWSALLFLLSVLAVAAIVYALRNSDAGIGIGGLVGFITSALALGREAEKVFAPIEARLTRATALERELRDRVTGKEAALTTQLNELEREVAAVDARITEAKNGASVQRFVLERATSDAYRRQLGLVATLHRDFEALGALLANEQEPHVDRIILYVDDLDRCPTNRVVEVLQAVHMLLALPLFVVVVGVDSRWLLLSLDDHYSRQFAVHAGERSGAEPRRNVATPQHYLEKIFQFPFTLRPMEGDGFARLVGDMIRTKQAPVAEASPQVRPPVAVGSRTIPEERDSKPIEAATPVASSVSEGVARENAAEAPVSDIAPIELNHYEVETLKSLSALVSSPRAARRLVNVYQHIRATAPPGDPLIGAREGEGEYRATAVMLAAMIGHPAASTELFEALVTKDGDAALILREFEGASDAAAELARALEGFDDVFTDLALVRRAIARVARYSFQTGRVLALLQRKTAAAARARSHA